MNVARPFRAATAPDGASRSGVSPRMARRLTRWRGAPFAVLVVFAVTVGVPTPTLADAQTPESRTSIADPRDDLSEYWRDVRRGVVGTTSKPDPRVGLLIQPDGMRWVDFRNGPVTKYGAWLLAGTVAALALFYLIRGRIRIERGRSGKLIARFSLFERSVHWITAGCFILLAITGFNVLYGRVAVKPWLGAEAFSALTLGGKYVHHYVGLVFIAALVVMFAMWIRHNVPNRHDWAWLLKGGGFFGRGAHPPARKFNAGQKLVYAAVVVGGGLIAYSGLNLMFPFTAGFTIQDMQFTHLLHGIAALILTAVIIAHIYIGTLGMEGGFEAMARGTVDDNWAREHHSLWVAELEAKAKHPAPGRDPAE